MLKMITSIGLSVGLFFFGRCEGVSTHSDLVAKPFPNYSYALSVLPKGKLEKYITNYFSRVNGFLRPVRREKLACYLTDFFPGNYHDFWYIAAFNGALQDMGSTPRVIRLAGIKQTAEADFLQISSAFLLDFTNAFVSRACVAKSYIRYPEFESYQISLRDGPFLINGSAKMRQLQQLRSVLLLNTAYSWSVALFRQDNRGNMTTISERNL